MAAALALGVFAAGGLLQVSGAAVLALSVAALRPALTSTAARRLGARGPAILCLALAPLAPALAVAAARAVNNAFGPPDVAALAWLHRVGLGEASPEILVGLAAAPFLAWIAAGRPRSLTPRPFRAVAAGVVIIAAALTGWELMRAAKRPAPDAYLASVPIVGGIDEVRALPLDVINWMQTNEARASARRSTYRRVAGVLMRLRAAGGAGGEEGKQGIPTHVGLRIEPAPPPDVEPEAEGAALYSFDAPKTPSHLVVRAGTPITFRRDDRAGVLLVQGRSDNVRAFALPEVELLGFPPRAALGALRPPTSWLAAALVAVVAAAAALLRRRAEGDLLEDASEEDRARARAADAGRAAFAIAAAAIGAAPLAGALFAGLG